MHLDPLFRSDGIGGYIGVIDSEKRPGFDDVERFVFHKKLDGGSGVATCLDFIEK